MTYSSTWSHDTGLPDIFRLDTEEIVMCDCGQQGFAVCAWLPIRAAVSNVVDPILVDALDLLHSLPQSQPNEALTSLEEGQRNARKLYTLELQLHPIARDETDYSKLLRCAAHVYTSRALRNLPRQSLVVSKAEERTRPLPQEHASSTTADTDVARKQLSTVLWALLLTRRPHEADLCVDCHLWVMYTSLDAGEVAHHRVRNVTPSTQASCMGRRIHGGRSEETFHLISTSDRAWSTAR